MLSRINMEKKEEHKSPHGWFIILLIVFTLCVFILTMVHSIEQENEMDMKNQKKEKENINPTKKLVVSPSTSLPSVPINIVRGGKVLIRREKFDIVVETIKRHLHVIPDTIIDNNAPHKTSHSTKNVSLLLHGYEIESVSVGKSFYVYDCNITPTADKLIVTVLMELPEIKVVFKDHPEYSKYYPTINPYIHVVEFVYLWAYDKKTMKPAPYMKLSNLKIFMVSWEDNLYKKSYEQVKNSPLYKVNVPIPLNIKKEELYDFLIQSTIFNQIPMIFNPPIILQPAQIKNTPI